MRAFIAIDVPEEISAAVARRQRIFREAISAAPGGDRGIRWTPPDGMHLTLKFLGEISVRQVEEATAALTAIELFHAFEATLKGFGFFPNAREPRVLWAGFEPAHALKALAARIDQQLVKSGFQAEKRPYSPHLTLARFRTPALHPSLKGAIDRAEQEELGSFRISEFFLFESKLSPGAATAYHKIARFPAMPALS